MRMREYRKDWANWAEVADRFGAPCPKREPRAVFAVYDLDGYEGHAIVIVARNRKFDVVEGSHCSCFGLENQWEPTTHGRRDLKKMLTATYGLFCTEAADIKKWLEKV